MDTLMGLWLVLFGQTVRMVHTTTTAYGTVEQVVADKFKNNAVKVNLAKVVRFIHAKESTNGKNLQGHHIYCRSFGKTNEYGFEVFGDHKRCFDTELEAVTTVTDWLVQRLPRYTLAQTLCIYNTGKPINDCPYYQSYLTFGE